MRSSLELCCANLSLFKNRPLEPFLRTQQRAYRGKPLSHPLLAKVTFGVFYRGFRTLEILETRNSRLQHSLSALEAEKGISGYRDTQDTLARVSDTQAGKNLLCGLKYVRAWILKSLPDIKPQWACD
jgi:hypothetical protein